MKRIFLTLTVLAHGIMIISLVLGLRIGDTMTEITVDPEVNSRVGTHILLGLAASTSATMVHALIFTYFMGTGRWLEETTEAYDLSRNWYQSNQKMKYGILPGILLSFLLILATGSLGAIADPATPASFSHLLGVSDSTLHFSVALTMWLATLAVNSTQFVAIARNSSIVDSVLAEVRRIRIERGLPV